MLLLIFDSRAHCTYHYWLQRFVSASASDSNPTPYLKISIFHFRENVKRHAPFMHEFRKYVHLISNYLTHNKSFNLESNFRRKHILFVIWLT